MMFLSDPHIHETSGPLWVIRSEKLENHAGFNANSIMLTSLHSLIVKKNVLFALLDHSIWHAKKIKPN